MKNSLLYGAAAIVSIMAVLYISSSEFRQKMGALGSVGKTLVKADCNQIPVVECSGIVVKAKHNIPTITRAAEYIVAVGSNTQVFMEIARIASEAEAECPRLDAVLDLSVMLQSDSMRIIALAEIACKLETPEQEVAWQAEYDRLASAAEYPSVEVALKRMKDR